MGLYVSEGKTHSGAVGEAISEGKELGNTYIYTHTSKKMGFGRLLTSLTETLGHCHGAILPNGLA